MKRVLTAAMVGLLAPMVSGAVIYSETFDNSTGAKVKLETAGWVAYAGATAAGPLSDTGAPSSGINAGTGWDGASAAPGFCFMTVAFNGGPALAWTDEFTVNRDADPELVFSWYGGNANTPGNRTQALALKIGDAWYVEAAGSDLDGAVTSGNVSSMTQKQVALDSASWARLDFVPGTILARGAAEELPAGDIEAFGIFFETTATSGNVNQQYDTFTITVVPEPGVAGMLGLAGLGLLRRRR